MGTADKTFVRTGDIAREFGLPESLARRIVLEHTRLTLLRSAGAWGVLLAGLAFAGWLALGPSSNGDLAVKILLATAFVWLLTGRWLAGPAIRKAAQDRSARAQGAPG